MSWPLAAKRSIIPACDVDLQQFEQLVKQTADLPMISAYKIGFVLGLSAGLPNVTEVARKYTDKPLIYDHQKAGTDIPDTGAAFMRVLKESGMDVVILFPQAGPNTQTAWIDAAKEEGLGVIVGGIMTHPGYTQSDGGYLRDEATFEIYRRAARQGVSDFVVPGNRPRVIRQVRALLEGEGVEPSFYPPGFLAQGGSLSEAAKAAGARIHPIVGRGIYKAEDPRQAVLDMWPRLDNGEQEAS